MRKLRVALGGLAFASVRKRLQKAEEDSSGWLLLET
jgi:hypothetical protein